jgi:hypothetical protein
MTHPQSSTKRLLLAAGLALGVLAAGLGGPTASAQPAPGSQGMPTLCPAGGCMAAPIHNVQVKPLGTQATLTFNTLQPAAVTIDYKPSTGPGAGGQSPAQGYATSHERTLTGLTSNTTYDVTVTATTQSGEKHTTQTSFTTAKKRVRLILDRITITDDGDWIGIGEPVWFWEVEWAGGKTGACYPNTTSSGLDHLVGVCQAGSYGEGVHFPTNDSGEKLMLTFAEEHFPTMPQSFTLRAGADETDLISEIIPLPEFTLLEDFEATWSVPQGKEVASQALTLRADEASDFRSKLDFRFELFHDNLSYPPNHGRARVRSNF